MRVHLGRAMPGGVARAVTAIAAELRAIDRAPGALVAGAGDPLLPPADVARPLVVLPACGPGRPAPWARALVAAADAVVLLDAGEAADLGAELAGRPVVVCGLPAPAAAPDGLGLAMGDGASPELCDLWDREGVAVDGAPGVAWVGGRGACAPAEALEAWAAGRAVVGLPGTPRHDLLRRGRALRAETVLEVVEATRFLIANPPLAAALAARGRAAAAVLPAPREVALRALEAVEVARSEAAVAR